MSAAIPFIIYLIVNSEVSIITKTRFGKCLPITLVSLTLLFYLFGFINMSIATYVVYMVVICAAIYIYRRSYVLEQIKSYVLTPGLLVFIIVFFFTAFLDKGKSFSLIDDWSHWGVMAKEMFRLKSHYNIPESLVIFHKSYPPFYTVVESSYCLLARTFSEGMCLQALQIFSLSMFLPLLEDNNKSKLSIVFISILVVLFGNVIVFTQELTYPSLFYNCLYVEWPMAIYLAYIIYSIIKYDFNSKIDFICLCIALCGFILTKQISIAFYLLVIVTLLFKLLFNSRKNIVMIILVVVAPLIFLLLWNISNTINGVSSEFNTSSFNYLALFKYFDGSLTEYQNSIFNSFINAIVFRPLIENPVRLPYISLLVTTSVVMFLIGFIAKEKQKDIKLIAVLVLLGGICYAYSICLSYMYTFDQSEALSLTMFNRYMLMYIVMCYALIFYLVVDYVRLRKPVYKYIALLILSILLTNKETIKYNFRITDYNKEINEQMTKYKYFLNSISKDKNVLLFWQHDIERMTAYKYNSILMGRIFDEKGMDCVEDVCPVTEEEFIDLLSKYDYMYICDSDNHFLAYWNLVDHDNGPYNDTAYEIVKNKGGIYLKQAN